MFGGYNVCKTTLSWYQSKTIISFNDDELCWLILMRVQVVFHRNGSLSCPFSVLGCWRCCFTVWNRMPLRVNSFQLLLSTVRQHWTGTKIWRYPEVFKARSRSSSLRSSLSSTSSSSAFLSSWLRPAVRQTFPLMFIVLKYGFNMQGVISCLLGCGGNDWTVFQTTNESCRKSTNQREIIVFVSKQQCVSIKVISSCCLPTAASWALIKSANASLLRNLFFKTRFQWWV